MEERKELPRTHHRISQRINAAEHWASCEGQSVLGRQSQPELHSETLGWGRSSAAEHGQSPRLASNTKPKKTSQKSQNPLWLKQVVTFSFTLIFLKLFILVLWEFCTMNFGHIHPPPTPPRPIVPHLPIQIYVLLLSLSTPVFIEYISNINDLLIIFTIFHFFYNLLFI